MAKEISFRYSFKGYNLLTALYRNKDLIKAILAILGGLNLVTVDWKVFLASLGIAVGTLILKIGIDALDFFFTEVEL